MNKLLCLAILISAPLLASAYSGKNYYGHEVVPSVRDKGDVTMNGTTVVGGTEVHGQLKANNAHLHALTVNGNVDLSETIISGASNIAGRLSANHSTLQQLLSIKTDEMTFVSTQSKDIVFAKGSYCRSQSLHLTHHSIVDGGVTFQCGKGTVYISAGSSMNGRVIGGRVVKG